MQAIELRNVTYAYDVDDTQQVAVSNVSLGIDEGQFVVLLGANGSGKSTLAKLLNGLLTPTKGQVLVYGQDTSTEDDDVVYSIRATVGEVFQNPDNQMVTSIIEDDVAFGPENLGIPHDEIAQRVQWALTAVGMWQYREHTPNKLSGGQKQRVAIAGILAMRPKVLVLDESTAMLDPKGRGEVMQVLRSLNRDHHITVVHITHHMDECIGADRALVMHQGRLLYDGTPDDLFGNVPLVMQAGLELPPLAEIAHSLRGVGVDLPHGIWDIDGFAAMLAPMIDVSRLGSLPMVPPAPCGEAVVDMQGVGYTYMRKTPYQKRALDDINLHIDDGQIVAIVGQTGSGKSTLVQHLNGLIKVEEGRMTVCDIDLNARRPDWKKLRFAVGMVFQYPEYQLFDETVAKDVGFGCRNAGVPKDEIPGKVRAALDKVGVDVDSIMERSPFELSGGQKRRVAIAGVVAMQPRVLVLDEPTAGLDPKGKREILQLVRSLHQDTCSTVLMVSHDMEAVARYADRVVLIKDGHIVDDCTPTQLFGMDEAALEQQCLRLPEATALCKVLRDKGIPMPLCLTTDQVVEVLAPAMGTKEVGV